jgi:hypothetical protein
MVLSAFLVAVVARVGIKRLMDQGIQVILKGMRWIFFAVILGTVIACFSN